MYTVIVPLDGSELAERAIGLGRMLAQALDGTLELVTVIEEPVLLDFMPTLMMPEREHAEHYLATVAERLLPGIPVQTTALRGSPVDEILAHAARRPNPIVAMSTHGRGGLPRILYGSVADKVTRGATFPVALVRGTHPVAHWQSRKILVPLDGSELAESALPLATALAGLSDGETHLLRVAPSFWNAPYLAYGSEAMYLSSEQIGELTEEAQAESRDYLDHVATRLRAAGARVSWEVRVGRPADEIIRVAETIEPDLVIMSSHGRGGIRRWALGSVAEEVLHRGTMPVVVVPRTDGTAQAGAASEATLVPA